MPRYRFTTSGGDSSEQDLDTDDAAEEHAREVSRAGATAVTVHRHSAHVDAWEYVDEADERE